MKKYKVIKEIPFIANIGEMWVEDSSVSQLKLPFNIFDIERMIELGFLEEIKEDNLEWQSNSPKTSA